MANLWTKLFAREERSDPIIDQNQWSQMFTFNGSNYPLGRMGTSGSSETIDSDFAGYVNGAYKSNGPVFACSLARMLIFSEMRFQFQKVQDGRPGDLFDKDSLRVLEKPWPNGTTGELLARAIQDTDFAGNHYVVRKEIPGLGPRLYRLRPDWVTIVLSAPPEEAMRSDVRGYIFKPGNTDDTSKWEVFPIDGSNGTVAHWSPIPDPEAQYRGMSWLTPVLREVMADKAIAKHKLKYFENGATPGLTVAFKETVTPEQFEEFMTQMDASHKGIDNAYETLYLGGGADVTVVGAHIEDFRALQGVGETRIASAARIHPAIVGFSDGMQGSSLNEGNFKAAKDLLGSGTLRPLWRSLCTAYDVLVDDEPNARLWYDDREISFLREDRQKIALLQQTQATTISRLVMQGFKPETAQQAVIEDDFRLLEHTGLYSVQLLPPNISHPENYPAQGGKALPQATAKNNQKGRPPSSGAPAKSPAPKRSYDELIEMGADPELATRLVFEAAKEDDSE